MTPLAYVPTRKDFAQEGGKASAEPGSQVGELESIRGISCIPVILFHLPYWSAVCGASLIRNAYLMVGLFFVISGFVICTAYADKIRTPKAAVRFLFLRIGRLYPVHLLFLLVFAAFEVAKWLARTRMGVASANSRPFEINDGWAFVQNLLLVQAWLPDRPLTFNYPSWSISVEFFTYMLFAAIVLCAHRGRLAISAAISALSLLLIVSGRTAGFDAMLNCFAGFFIGCLTAEGVRRWKLVLPSWIPLAAIVGIIVFDQLRSTRQFDAVIYGLTALLIGTLALSNGGVLKAFLNLRFFRWMGALSYSIYMSHAAVEWVINQVIRVTLDLPQHVAPDGSVAAQLTPAQTWFAFGIVLACVLLVSQVVHTFIEKPLRERSRRYAAVHFA